MKRLRFGILALAAAMCMIVYATNLYASDKTPTTPDNGSSFSLPSHFLGDLVATGAFGLMGIFLIGFGAKMVDWIWKDLDMEKQVQAGNLSSGVVMASVVLGLCYLVAHVIAAVIG